MKYLRFRSSVVTPLGLIVITSPIFVSPTRETQQQDRLALNVIISRAQLQQDFIHLVGQTNRTTMQMPKSLEKGHSGLYRDTSKEGMEKAFDRAMAMPDRNMTIVKYPTVVIALSDTTKMWQESPTKISEAEIKSAINSRSDVEECNSLDEIHIDYLEYHDFIGDGRLEAVVIASTCMTGTAGPDIHGVYGRDADGKVVELPFHHAEGDSFFNRSGWNIPVFGNANYGLTVDNGELVARWNDSSDRESPVVVWYKWDGKKFVMDHMKVDGPFPTSYECAKATKELDRAICYSPSVAALDVQLGQAYRAVLQELPREKKQEFQTQQREWLVRREKECSIYKWWVDCLRDLYTKRIAELKKR
jgi:uncharacterized protein YecT (DUF1311 family)